MQNILKGKYGVHSHSSIIGRQKTVNVYSCFLKLVIIRVARSSIKCLLLPDTRYRLLDEDCCYGKIDVISGPSPQ